MTTTSAWGYRAVGALAIPMVPQLFRSSEDRAAHLGRLAATRRLAEWGESHRDPARPLVWLHASSVGEGLTARAVLRALRSRHPELQVVFTHFSPSAAEFAAAVGADVHDYLPYDLPRCIDPVLQALRPTLLLFARLDLWPLLATRAHAAGSRVALVGATVRPDSGRLRWPIRSLIRPGYAALDLALAASSDDAARLPRLGVAVDRIVITGDPRIDDALGRVRAVSVDDPWRHLADPDTTLVAGSTWPGDERVLLEAFTRVRRRHPATRLIVVPHQPTADHLTGLVKTATCLHLPPPVPCGAAEAAQAPLVVVDRTGQLVTLYADGGIAYVGGGFGGRGIHSVVEPAAWQRPVITGPTDRGAREVALLRGAGGLRQLPVGPSAVSALVRLWEEWLDDPAARHAAGRAAHAALTGDCGAAARTADRLDGWLAGR